MKRIAIFLTVLLLSGTAAFAEIYEDHYVGISITIPEGMFPGIEWESTQTMRMRFEQKQHYLECYLDYEAPSEISLIIFSMNLYKEKGVTAVLKKAMKELCGQPYGTVRSYDSADPFDIDDFEYVERDTCIPGAHAFHFFGQGNQEISFDVILFLKEKNLLLVLTQSRDPENVHWFDDVADSVINSIETK